ncbi:DUF4429 domain-containing protein [Clostridium baratii]|uniref:DUF4429 domain-containing protein n=1 Tax=Clostridium baratii TaxID=1561 RepID=UPI0006BA9A76|nr:DUF4429 domain-containing protein [Clostridium baratii]
MGVFGGKKRVEDNNVGDNSVRCYNLKSNGKYEITIEDNFISITPKGVKNAINKGLVGTKKIDMNNITGVQFKASGMTTGYLQFLLIGSQDVKGGVMAAVKDENTILFTKKEENIILEIKAYVEAFIDNKNSVAQNNKQQFSAADEILKFKQLLDIGAITEEEFEAKKKSILNL